VPCARVWRAGGSFPHCHPRRSSLMSLSLSLSLFLPRLVDEIVWVKTTVNRRLAKSHGYYLQHAKEACLVGRKGAAPAGARACVGADVICAERRGQSQKPEEIYQLVEALVPNGKDGRKNARVAGFFLRLHHLITTLSTIFHSPPSPLSLPLSIFHPLHRLVPRDFWPQEQSARLLGDGGKRGDGQGAAPGGCGGAGGRRRARAGGCVRGGAVRMTR